MTRNDGRGRGIAVTLGIVTPDVDIALWAVLRRPAGSLEPRMQITGVVQHQIQNHPHVLAVGRREEPVKGRQVAQIGMNSREIGDVMAAIPQRRWIDRRQPERLHPKPAQIGQPRSQSLEIPRSVTVAIGKAANDELVNNGA